MFKVDSLAEAQILSAIRKGEFDNLPGQGKPLVLDDDSGIPQELRVAYRILRNAGCLPPELTLRNEITQLEGLLDQVELDAEDQSIRRRICFLKTRLAMHGHDVNLLAQECDYRQKLTEKLAREARPLVKSNPVLADIA